MLYCRALCDDVKTPDLITYISVQAGPRNLALAGMGESKGPFGHIPVRLLYGRACEHICRSQ
jgi:hypothetical protein